MPALAVSKMHGTLNDFIVVDLRNQTAPSDAAAFARKWCDRRAGIGADGVLLIEPDENADARMRIINADGSEAEMCGNGIRCVARYLHENGEGTHFRIATLAGPIGADIVHADPIAVRVDMGVPQIGARVADLPNAVFVSMGNPHVVLFTDIATFDLGAAGAALPEMNVHAVESRDGAIAVRHHERGAGFTQACGTGAVASAAVAIDRHIAKSPVTVHVPGGMLEVEWDGSGHAFLTGPAERVFDASIDP